MALVEGAAAAVLSTEAYRNSVPCQAAESKRFRHSVVERTLANTHLGTLLQQLLNLGMNVETRGVRGQARKQFGQFLACQERFPRRTAVCNGRP